MKTYMSQEYRIDYTVTVYGKSRSSVKNFYAYCWTHAKEKLVAHVSNKWLCAPTIQINNASVNGDLIDPTLFTI